MTKRHAFILLMRMHQMFLALAEAAALDVPSLSSWSLADLKIQSHAE
jgi:hypothetical protein